MYGMCNMNDTLYIFGCPIGHPDCKIGVTGDLAKRLGVYQNSYSPRTMAQFNFAYVGTKNDIKALEKVIKDLFYQNIEHDNLGRTEWISDYTPAQMSKEVDAIIKGHNFKVVKISDEYLPINVNNICDLHEYYENKNDEYRE
jgi:hypothetical protein